MISDQSNNITAQDCHVLLYQNIKHELNHAIKARIRWLRLTKVVEIITHVLQGASTIFVFLAAATNVSDFGIVAGCCGISSAALLVYGQYCKRNHEYFITKIQKICYQVGIQDKLNYMNREIISLNNINNSLQRKIDNGQINLNNRSLLCNDDSSITSLQSTCRSLINLDIKNEFKKNIIASNRWEKLYKYLEVMGYVFQGTTGILAFIAFALNIQAISILSGCMGVGSCILLSYSQNCKSNHENTATVVQKILELLEIPVNESDLYQPPNNTNSIIELPNRERMVEHDNYEYPTYHTNMLMQYNNSNIREIPYIVPINNDLPRRNPIPTPVFY